MSLLNASSLLCGCFHAAQLYPIPGSRGIRGSGDGGLFFSLKGSNPLAFSLGQGKF